ncbi:MAG TPA: prephenate dehydrogenase [Candidatus Acidoferrales bacterium]|nr:prephenate dehydrogenase [Candidatus Acidoferrales bacterium]
MASDFFLKRVAILGTGLIGGSFALALREHSPQTRIMGFDREAALREALERRAIEDSSNDLASAVKGADLVYIALPISATIELLPEIARHSPADALVTDACSTKRAVCKVAAQHFKSGGALFLGGHPMAGRESSGIAAANASLFAGSPYLLIGEEPNEEKLDSRVAVFLSLIEKLGAHPKWLDADTHDWAVGIISHLPQLASIALANLIAEEDDDPPILPALAGPGARDALRLAGSPYAMWRDIALTNSDNIARALDRLSQAIEHLRAQLTSRELEKLFAEANRLQRSL